MNHNYYSRIYIALQEMKRVIHALILREIRTQFGDQRLGYIWAFLEPLLMMGLFIFIFSVRGIGMKVSNPNMGLELFIITGFIPYFLFRDIMSASVRALNANRQLLTYPQVQIHDVILARFLLEFATTLIVFSILIFAVDLLNLDDVAVESPIGVFAGLLMMALYGLGLGLCLSSLYPLFPSIQPISEALLGRPLFFTSGLFFTAEMLPSGLREILLWNPLFQTIQFIRGVLFKGVAVTHFDPGYTIIFLVLLLFLGLLMQRALHRYILSFE